MDKIRRNIKCFCALLPVAALELRNDLPSFRICSVLSGNTNALIRSFTASNPVRDNCQGNIWYLTQVISIITNRYNIYFMDGYPKEDLPGECDIRMVPERQMKRHSQAIGKTFDPGDEG